MPSTTQPPSEFAQEIAFHRIGEGAPVILLHGVGLRKEAWAPLAELLSQRFECFALDLPGHGKSPRLGLPKPHLRDFTDGIARAVKDLTSEPPLLIGHSMGALIALDLAIRHPGLCRGLVCLNAVFQRSDAARRAVANRAASLEGTKDKAIDGTIRRWFGADPKDMERAAAETCRQWLEEVDPDAYAAAYSVFATHDGPAPDDLRRIAAPSLFLTGADDPNSTPAMSEAMADLVPDGRAISLPGAAHMAPMTHGEHIADAILATFPNLGISERKEAGHG